MRQILLVLIVTALLGLLAGCGNVSLSGEALQAAQGSAMDAYQAYSRAAVEPATPDWEKAYLLENAKQWRSYVRSAVKDTTWGPKLPDDPATTQPVK